MKEQIIEVALGNHIERIAKHTAQMVIYSQKDEYEKAIVKKALIKELNKNFMSHLIAEHYDDCLMYETNFFVKCQALPSSIHKTALKCLRND